MPELIACPSCGCRVQVADMMLGQRTRCIACSVVFIAAPELAPPPGVPQSKEHYPLPPEATPPAETRKPAAPAPGRSLHRLPLCPGCHRPVSWEAADCPHCGHLFDTLDAISRGEWISRRDADPHRGKLIDTLGTISMLGGMLGLCTGPLGVLVALALGIPALVMARGDLARMRAGTVDAAGRSWTEWGRNKAIVGIVLGVMIGLFCILFVIEHIR